MILWELQKEEDINILAGSAAQRTTTLQINKQAARHILNRRTEEGEEGRFKAQQTCLLIDSKLTNNTGHSLASLAELLPPLFVELFDLSPLRENVLMSTYSHASD